MERKKKNKKNGERKKEGREVGREFLSAHNNTTKKDLDEKLSMFYLSNVLNHFLSEFLLLVLEIRQFVSTYSFIEHVIL